MQDCGSVGRRSWFVLCGAVCVVLVALFALLASAICQERSLLSPDNPAFLGSVIKKQLFCLLRGEWATPLLGMPQQPIPLSPDRILLWLPVELYHPLSYAINVLFTFAATAYLLRVLRLGWPAAVLGGLAMSLSGHYFTLIAAGHISKFRMVPFAVLLFAFVTRAVESGAGILRCESRTRWKPLLKTVFYSIMAGTAAGCGLSEHEDVMFMFLLLAVVYSIFAFIRCWPKSEAVGGDQDNAGGKQAWHGYVGRMIVGGLLATVFFTGVMMPKLASTFLITLQVRSSMVGGENETRDAKYEFATNWSLPPEELVEFVVPCLFGTESGDPAAPYWGRLGRSLRWEETKQGLMNLRQHTVYLGAIQMVFAVLAVVMVLGAKRREMEEDGGRRTEVRDQRSEVRGQESEVRGQESEIRNQKSEIGARGQVIFWSIAWVVCVLMALGRYGPAYQIFFSLPLADSIRAPVKFMHLVELCTCVLFAYGVHFFLCEIKRMSKVPEDVADSPKTAKGSDSKMEAQSSSPGGHSGARTFMYFAIACAVLGCVALVAAGVVIADSSSVVDAVSKVGLKDAATKLVLNMAGAFFHSAVLFLFCMAIFIAARKLGARPKAAMGIWMLLLMALAADLVLVDRRFVRTSDQRSYYAMNSVLQTLKDSQPARVSFPAQDWLGQVWPKFAFNVYEIDKLDLSFVSSYADMKEFFGVLMATASPERMWQLTNTRFIVAPAQLWARLAKVPGVRLLKTFGAVPEGESGFKIVEVQPQQASHVLAENTNALPRVALYYNWKSVGGEAKELADPSWDPARTVLLTGGESGGGDEPAVPVENLKYTPEDISFKVSAKADAVALLNDRYDPNWKVWVDGKEAMLLKCNYLMRGVRVPAGEHEVRFKYVSPYITMVKIRFMTLGVVLLLLAGYGCWAAMKRP